VKLLGVGAAVAGLLFLADGRSVVALPPGLVVAGGLLLIAGGLVMLFRRHEPPPDAGDERPQPARTPDRRGSFRIKVAEF